MTDREEWQFLELNGDEAEHNKCLAGQVEQHLALAENAAVITLNGLMSLEDYPRINEPEVLVSLLMAKTAKHVRFAVIGLKLGYYAGASAVLRSALESLSYASLFNSYPAQVAIWIRNEFSNRSQSDLDRLRNEQTRDAKKALLNLENDPHIIKSAMIGFWQEANKYSHATLQGLAKEFQVDVEYLVPDELAEAEDDFDWALERYALLSSFGKNILHEDAYTREKEEETIGVQLAGRYDEDTLFDLSLFAFYIAHRLLDMTNIFTIRDKEFKRNYRDWHDAIRELGEPTE